MTEEQSHAVEEGCKKMMTSFFKNHPTYGTFTPYSEMTDKQKEDMNRNKTEKKYNL